MSDFKRIDKVIPIKPVVNPESDLLIKEIIKNNLTLAPLFKSKSKNMIRDNHERIIAFDEHEKMCFSCKGISECESMFYGFSPLPEIVDDVLTIKLKKCRYNKMTKSKSGIVGGYVFDDLKPTYKDTTAIDLFNDDKERFSVLKKLIKVVPKGFYLHGKPGIGKTFFMSTITNDAIKKNKSVVFAKPSKLIREFKSRLKDNGFEALKNKVIACDILVLDDIGRKQLTDWEAMEILDIIEERHNKINLFTSNYELNKLSNYIARNTVIGEKIVSEISSQVEEYMLPGKRR